MEDLNKKEQEPKLKLVEPSSDYKESFIEGIREFQAEGRDANLNIEDLEKNFSDHLEKKQKEAKGIDLKENQVPSSNYWLVDDDGFVGQTWLRHNLNEHLLQRGGNIGYEIRATKRGLGYGTKILELALEKAREIGLEKVLLTCNKDNVASRKIIEKHGGIMEDEKTIEGDRGDMITIQRFWIDLKNA